MIEGVFFLGRYSHRPERNEFLSAPLVGAKTRQVTCSGRKLVFVWVFTQFLSGEGYLSTRLALSRLPSQIDKTKIDFGDIS